MLPSHAWHSATHRSLGGHKLALGAAWLRDRHAYAAGQTHPHMRVRAEEDVVEVEDERPLPGARRLVARPKVNIVLVEEAP